MKRWLDTRLTDQWKIVYVEEICIVIKQLGNNFEIIILKLKLPVIPENLFLK